MLDLRFQATHAHVCLLVPLLVSVAAAQPAATPKGTPAKVVLRGTVVDDKGKPVAGAIVRGSAVMMERQGEQTATHGVPVPPCKTDERGAFTLEFPAAAKAGLTLYLCGGRENAFTAAAREVHGGDLEKPITLTISPRNARALRVRVVDEEGKAVADAAVLVRNRPRGMFTRNEIKPVDLPKEVRRATDRAGHFQTPPCLDPDGVYQVELKADGFFADKTPWKRTTATPEIVFETTLRRVRLLQGQIVDCQGKPVAGARVVRSDERHKVETITDGEGSFQLRSAFFAPGFLYVSQAGFRFHGQRSDRPDTLKIVLTRREENQPRTMTTLPPVLPRAKRKELAARLLEPLLQQMRKVEGDNDRAQLLQTLGRLDAGRLLVELDSRPVQNAWYDAYIRRAAVQGLKDEAPEEAQAILESMRDAGFRSMAYLDLCDALPAGRKTEKRSLLHQALLHARGISGSDHRIIQFAWVARRLWDLGDKESATKLLREGQEIARALPTAGWSGYARGAFAEDLALIDLDAALELMKDLKNPLEFVRHHGNLAHKLAGRDPAAAERVFGILLAHKDVQSIYQRDHYAVRICHRMAPVDLARARKIADAILDPYCKARSYGVMAQALARRRPRQARGLLDQAFDLLEKHVASGQDAFNGSWDAASLAGLMLPAAEEIDAALVPEFFWRTLSLRRPIQVERAEDEWRLSRRAEGLGALALVLARYDRKIAMAFVEEASKRTSSQNPYRFSYLRAAALADPQRTGALLEALDDLRNKDRRRLSVVDMLLAEGDGVWKIVHSDLGQWFMDDEDL